MVGGPGREGPGPIGQESTQTISPVWQINVAFKSSTLETLIFMRFTSLSTVDDLRQAGPSAGPGMAVSAGQATRDPLARPGVLTWTAPSAPATTSTTFSV